MKIVGTLKKDENFYITELFCSKDAVKVTMSSGEVEGFSPKVLFATSGAANAGIDNSLVHGVFRGEIPPTIEDAAQEIGRAGRRAGANKDSDLYVTCISLESYLILLKRIHTSTVGMPTY